MATSIVSIGTAASGAEPSCRAPDRPSAFPQAGSTASSRADTERIYAPLHAPSVAACRDLPYAVLETHRLRPGYLPRGACSWYRVRSMRPSRWRDTLWCWSGLFLSMLASAVAFYGEKSARKRYARTIGVQRNVAGAYCDRSALALAKASAWAIPLDLAIHVSTGCPSESMKTPTCTV